MKADQLWIDHFLRGVRTMARTRRPFQCYDLVTQCGVPEPADHHMWGPAMNIARAEGYIVQVAAVPSSRPKTARSLCRLWIGAAAWVEQQRAEDDDAE